MRSLLVLLISALLTVALVIFLRVDQRVGDRLAGRQTSGLSLVLSGTSQVRSGTPAAKLIRKRVEARNYRETSAAKPSPGEFSVKGDLITVTTRPFRDSDRKEVPARSLRVNVSTGEITDLGGDAATAITLEPVSIAPLGSSEVRASSFRPLAELPKSLQQAFLAIEDKRFYSHIGVDPVGIARAMAKNIAAGKLVEGGSTLSQQLAKNILFTPKKTLGRKVMEMFAALSLERRLTKEQILEMYLNEIYFSQEGQVSVHGVQEASQSFFAKDVTKLTVGEGALLAGLIKAPSSYSPRRNMKRAIARRNLVLTEMRDQGFIDEKAFTAAVGEKITLGPPPFRKKDAPFFVSAVEKQLGETFDIEGAAVSGVQVHTWLDPEIQKCAEQAVSESIAALEKANPRLRKKHKGRVFEQSLVAIEPFSGAVKAWVGGRDFSANQFDHVGMARRQIGSTIKPFLYLTALDASLNSYKVATPISILSDEPTGITLFDRSQWTPENYDHTFRGDVTLRYALERSLNIPAVYVAQRVGIPALAQTLHQFDVSPEIPQFPALALGALDTTLLRLTAAYGALANGGRLVSPRLYSSVMSPEGGELTSTVHNEVPVAQEGPVYLVTDILRGVVQRGTAQVIRRMGYKGVAAGKTGTSNEARDAWFVGFTPRLAVGIWTGYDDNSPLGLTGGVASAPTWARFMQCVEPLVESEDFIRPPSVEAVPLDKELLCRASPDYPRERVITELFVQGTAPREECNATTNPDHEEYPRTGVEAAPEEGATTNGDEDAPNELQSPDAQEQPREVRRPVGDGMPALEPEEAVDTPRQRAPAEEVPRGERTASPDTQEVTESPEEVRRRPSSSAEESEEMQEQRPTAPAERATEPYREEEEDTWYLRDRTSNLSDRRDTQPDRGVGRDVPPTSQQNTSPEYGRDAPYADEEYPQDDYPEDDYGADNWR